MSDDEEQLALGRDMLDYRKAKARLSALQSEATSIGRLMKSMGETLTFARPGLASFTPESFAKLNQERIILIVNEIETVWAEFERLTLKLKSLGLLDAQ